MRGGVGAELLLLRKRASTWILLGLWSVLTAFFSYVLPYAEGAEESGRALRDLLPDSLAGNLLAGFPFFGGVFALILGVLAMGSEYGFDTLKTLFTQGPARLRVLGAKLLALGAALVPFVLAVFLVGAVASYVIAQSEGAPVDWPSAWLLLRALAAGWLILAAWAALGVLLGVVSRGTGLAIGIGILYALVIEGLLSNFAGQVNALAPLAEVFVRSNSYSIAEALGAPVAAIESSGPGAFGGPFVSSAQALLALAAYIAGSLLLSALLMCRRDVA